MTVMATLVAANLTPLVTMIRRGELFRLLTDETTRDHRRTSFAAGFWAAIVSAGSVYGVSIFVDVAPGDVARVVITAALAAALIAFATLAWQATGA
ncbi:hypothetical protein BH23ACT10_BH23ACT10_11510 [soil metagenome]